MDKLRITGLRASALIGIHDWERQTRQRVCIDLECDVDARVPAESDAISKALDYDALARRVLDLVGGDEFRLIETLAERIAARLIDEFAVSRVKVVLHKPGAVPAADDTSIEIERRAR